MKRELLFILQFDYELQRISLRKYYEVRLDVLARCIIASFSRTLNDSVTTVTIVDKNKRCLVINEGELEPHDLEDELRVAKRICELVRNKQFFSLGEVLERIIKRGNYALLILDEGGIPILEVLDALSKNYRLAIFIGGYKGFSEDIMEEIGKAMRPQVISLGRIPYLSSMCILILKYILTRGSTCLVN